MVNNHARIFVPGWNLSMLDQAFTTVSCTRSSAAAVLRVSDLAKARREVRWSTISSRGSVAICDGSFLGFELSNQVHEPIRQFVFHRVVVDAFKVLIDLLFHFALAATRIHGSPVSK
mmetsp:Transcript_7241/g.12649  ORF Transcript_7241/g.12649 Transcript_7241/m.12649 type:complete len:117 (-) Transcript_7241:357-707(-)